MNASTFGEEQRSPRRERLEKSSLPSLLRPLFSLEKFDLKIRANPQVRKRYFFSIRINPRPSLLSYVYWYRILRTLVTMFSFSFLNMYVYIIFTDRDDAE